MPSRITPLEQSCGFGIDLLDRSMAIYAPGRAQRPGAFHIPLNGGPPQPPVCPFCPGNEDATPPEWLAVRDPGDPVWKARIVPNRFPAVVPWDESGKETGRTLQGVHDVVVESTDHQPYAVFTPLDHAVRLWEMILLRLHALYADKRIRHLVWFRNQGSPAGASLVHPHSQILGISQIPPGIRQRNRAAAAFFRKNGCSWVEHLRQKASRGRKTVVLHRDGLIALCPPASRTCYEMVVIPKKPVDPRIPTLAEAAPLAQTLALLIGSLQKTVGAQVPFNMALQIGPHRAGDWFTWHVEILPRMSQLAGWEWATGSFVNPIPPEMAAGRLRENLDQAIGSP